MNRLRDIKISPKECRELLQKRRFSKGGESVICYSDNSHTLYKIFVRDPQSEVVTEMPENKFAKVTALHQKKLQHSIQPVSTISINGKLRFQGIL